MKYNIYVNQKVILDSGLGLSLDEAIILDFINGFVHSDAVHKLLYNGKIYYWVSYDLVRKELPILELKKDSVYRKFKRLIDLRLLDAHPDNATLGRAYFALNTNFVKLFYSDAPPEENPGGVRKSIRTPPEKNPHYNTTIDNTTIDNTEANASPSLFAQGSKKPSKVRKMPDRAYSGCVDVWLKQIHPGWVFGGVQGKALKSLVSKLRGFCRQNGKEGNDVEVVDVFYIFCSQLPDWFKDKDLPVLDSKYNEIITQIANGTGSKRVAADGLEWVNELYSRTATKPTSR